MASETVTKATTSSAVNASSVPRPPEPQSAELPPAVADLWLLADTQLNNVLAITTRTHSKYVKFFANAAIRPPTLDLWSEVVLANIVEQMNKSDSSAPVLFMGDGANTSCIGEFSRFLSVMSKAHWLGVLGNHDGFYMGNYTWAPDAADADATKPNTWSGACNDFGQGDPELLKDLEVLEHKILGVVNTYTRMRTMPKAVAVWLYLHDLHVRGVIADDPLTQTWSPGGLGFEFARDDGKAPWDASLRTEFYASVGAFSKTVPGDPDINSRAWNAFIAQHAQMTSSLDALLVDTSDFDARPPSGFLERAAAIFFRRYMPGEFGNIGELQARKLEDWASHIHKDGRSFIVVGHHDWQSMSPDGQKRLRRLFAVPGFVAYVSGHTHKPTARADADGSGDWELNVASVTDWPMEFAKAHWERIAGETSLETVTMPIGLHRDEGNRCPLINHENKITERGAERNYNTVETYMRRAATQYSRLLSILATRKDRALLTSCDEPCLNAALQDARDAARMADNSQRREKLKSLIELDRTKLREHPWVREAEMRCAIWASEMEGGGKKTIKHGKRLPPTKWPIPSDSAPR